MNSLKKKLLFSIGLPALLVSVAGVGFFYRRADAALQQSTQDQAVALAELLTTTFALADNTKMDDGRSPTIHRSVTEAVRSDWKMFRYVESLRILDATGTVKWSRRVEEEGKPLPDSARLLSAGPDAVRFNQGRLELVRPLGGVSCGGCHSERTMKVGVMQLTIDEPRLHREVSAVFQSALSALLILAAAIGLVTFLSLHFLLTRPLVKLTGLMKRAEEGDFLVRADEKKTDEIGTLGKAFNQMLARITSMKADEIDTRRDLQQAKTELGLKDQLEDRVKELQLLFDVSRSLNETLELPELLGVISALITERLNIPQFSIMLLSPDGKLEVKTAWPPNLGTEGLTFSIGTGACGRAAESRQSVYIPDLMHDSTGIFQLRAGAKEERGALLSVPMVHKGALLGVMNFERPQIASFAAEEIELLEAVTAQAALAAKNARLHEETVALSVTDSLTGVPNRRHLMGRLELEIARANRFGTQLSMLMVDIDHFKQLNDTAGHLAGDSVLRQVCELMKQSVRKVDTLARYGGEEFVVLLPQVTKAEALEVADKLRRAVAEAPIQEGRAQPLGRVSISVGVANLPVDSTAQERLIDAADSALYAAKRAGRDKVVGFAQGMEQHPGRERGPHATRRRTTAEIEAAKAK